MLPDRVSNPGPLTYESGVLPIALRGPANHEETKQKSRHGTTAVNYWECQLVCVRPTLALSSALAPQTLSCLVCVRDF